MSKWSDEACVAAYEDTLRCYEARIGATSVATGRAILDLRSERDELRERVSELEQHAIRIDMHTAEQWVRAEKAEQERDNLSALLGLVESQREKAEQRCAALEAALKMLHDDVDEYQRINRLGGHDNHALVAARSALSGDTAALREMLEKAAALGIAEWEPDWEHTPERSADIAKRVMEGK